jgi:hypothetical protein
MKDAEVEYLDQPPAHWFVLDVMPTSDCRPGHLRDWSALMVDVDPYTDDFRMWSRRVSERFVRIPGKHRSRDAACEALENMMATRH